MSDRTIRYGVAATVGAALLAWSSMAAAFTYTNPNCSNGASWPNLPVDYQINRDGSADMSFSQTKQIVDASFQEWSSPCCSTFDASNAGTTTQSALDVRGDATADPVLSWIEQESNWPQFLGDPSRVIGVTMSSFSGCDIVNAPILFNGVRFTYRPAGKVDLQSIATHEIGHLLGLGHSSAQGATMAPQYLGGTKQQSIEQDDINGVCSMYGGGSCGCSSDSDCPSGQRCNSSNQCEEIPCTSDADCSNGKECNTSTGDCQEPTCSSDSDCSRAGYECDTSTGTCVLGCRVCKECNSDADCGTPDDLWGCVATDGGRNFCLRACPEGNCPGDSTCTDVEIDGRNGTRTVPICLNPGACKTKESTICPSSYVCGEGQVENGCSAQSSSETDAGTTQTDAGSGTTSTSGDAGGFPYVDASGESAPDTGSQPGTEGTSGSDEASCAQSGTCAPDAGAESDAGGSVVAIQNGSGSSEPRAVGCATAGGGSGAPMRPFGWILLCFGALALRTATARTRN